MSEPVTREQLADALEEVSKAILQAVLGTIQGITPGSDTAGAMQGITDAINRIEHRVTALRQDQSHG